MFKKRTKTIPKTVDGLLDEAAALARKEGRLGFAEEINKLATPKDYGGIRPVAVELLDIGGQVLVRLDAPESRAMVQNSGCVQWRKLIIEETKPIADSGIHISNLHMTAGSIFTITDFSITTPSGEVIPWDANDPRR